MGVVLCGRDLPAVSELGAAVATLDGAAIDHELGLGGDRVVMVNPSSPPERSFGRLAHQVFGFPPVQVIMLVYPLADPSGPDLRRWCGGIADFGRPAGGVALAEGAVSPASVRREVASQVARCPESVRSAAPLAASELVSNALQHVGDGRFEIEVTPDAVTLAVFDTQPTTWPAPIATDPLAPAGRGLSIVAAISSTWGITAGRVEKSVWCELR
jgi:Histidine kinase-like ATPase domain